jgi:hypothetical protein
MAIRSRIHLGTRTGLSFVHKVYRTPDAIEVDEIEGVDVTRRRVLLEEVQLVTYHHAYGVAFVLTLTALSVVFTVLSGLIALGDRAIALVVFALTGLPSLVLLGLRLALGIDVLTVHGLRTRAEVHFWLRKGRGREIYRQVCQLARERQTQLTRQLARAPRAAAPPLPAPASPPDAAGEPLG